MTAVTVSIKWGKEKFDKVELDTNEPTEVFQAQLFALSGVPPERQKIMAKGKVLKETWSGFPVKSGMTLLMMGSADELPAEPVKKTKFVEDEEKEGGGLKVDGFSAGLINLGNTCYMNATLQCLKNVPELKTGLSRLPGTMLQAMQDPASSFCVALRDLYKQLDKADSGFPPYVFLQLLHSIFPQFAEKGEGGVFQQQDANECWTQVMRMLQQKLPKLSPIDNQATASGSLIDQFFGVDCKAVMKCDETEDEVETTSTERLYQLSCFISQDVKYLHTGLRNRLKETITKASSTLNRDASYTKTSLITRLPAYLTIQFVRFFYKEKEKVNAKILKDIKYTMLLDVYELCSPELQERLLPMRNRFKEKEDKDAEKKAAATKDDNKKMDVDKAEKEVSTAPYSFEDDPGSNNSGYYELNAVLTHKGRSSSSGHYVAWVRIKGDQWLMYDDDNVHGVTKDDVLKLSGGGDWHSAYVLLYAPRKLELD